MLCMVRCVYLRKRQRGMSAGFDAFPAAEAEECLVCRCKDDRIFPPYYAMKVLRFNENFLDSSFGRAMP